MAVKTLKPSCRVIGVQAAGAGGGAYPVSLPITTTIAAVRSEYGDLVADDTTGVTVG